MLKELASLIVKNITTEPKPINLYQFFEIEPVKDKLDTFQLYFRVGDSRLLIGGPNGDGPTEGSLELINIRVWMMHNLLERMLVVMEKY